MITINEIILMIGYGVVISLGIIFVGFICYLGYLLVDYYFKKILGWQDRESRKDIIYYIKNKKEIREYIKLKRDKN